MTLTPDEIVNYPLKQAMRGYSVRQVDELLDQVADEIEGLHRRLDEARRDLEDRERRLAETGETEATLKRTLITAQRTAERSISEARDRATEIVDEARREAATLLDEARLEAEELRSEALQSARAEEADLRRRRQGLEERIDGLRRFERDFVARLRDWLDSQVRHLEELHAEPPVAEGEAGGDPGRPLEETGPAAGRGVPAQGPDPAGPPPEGPGQPPPDDTRPEAPAAGEGPHRVTPGEEAASRPSPVGPPPVRVREEAVGAAGRQEHPPARGQPAGRSEPWRQAEADGGAMSGEVDHRGVADPPAGDPTGEPAAGEQDHRRGGDAEEEQGEEPGHADHGERGDGEDDDGEERGLFDELAMRARSEGG